MGAVEGEMSTVKGEMSTVKGKVATLGNQFRKHLELWVKMWEKQLSTVVFQHNYGKLIMLNLIWLRKITVNKDLSQPARITHDHIACN